MHSYETLSEAINDLNKRGYTEDFNLKPECVACASLELELHPEHFTIDEYYRFEGVSNPSDSSVIYAISSNTGIKGVLIDAYGVYADSLSDEMIKKLKVEHNE